MTRSDFESYLKSLLPLMRLNHWTIKVGETPPKNDTAWASVVCWDGRFGATIYLSDGILSETPEDQRYVAIHELAHCYFAHSDKLADADLSPSRREAWTLAMEYGIDAIAETLAPHLPLPLKVTNGTPEPA